MAEGFLRHLGGDRFDVYSAGTEPKGAVHPLAVRVMAEEGIDIAGQQPKHLREFLGRLSVRYLIIVCSGADESCPRIFPGMAERLYWPFDDPAESGISEFRRVRDEIKSRIAEWLN